MKIFRIIVKVTLGMVAVLLFLDIALVTGMARWQSTDFHSKNAIVLGAAIYTPALKNRTLQALDLYKQGRVEHLVLSGGKISPNDISEADYMEQVVLYYQDEPVRYEKEDQSHNTYENITNSKKFISVDDPVVIVSDEFHLARAVLLAKRAGFEKVYWKAPEPNYYSTDQLRFYYLRELVAMISYIPKFIYG